MKKIFAASVVALAAAAGVAAAGSLAFADGAGAVAVKALPTAVTPAGSTVAVPVVTSSAGRGTATASPAKKAAPLDLAEARLSYRKNGDTVTATRKGKKVVAITLTSAKYAAHSAHVKFTVDAERSLTIDPQMFILWDAQSRENSATATTPVVMNTGRHTLSLTFTDLRSEGQAIGWAPSDGYAVWPRTKTSKALDLANANVSYVKNGAIVTVSQKHKVIATIALTSAKYAAHSATVKFTVDAKQSLTIDPQMFILWDAQSRENGATATTPVVINTGRHSLNLTFTDLRSQGQAIGWAPSNGSAVWAR